MMFATLLCAVLGIAQPAPETAKPIPPPEALPHRAEPPAPPGTTETSSPDGIPLAGIDAGAVRVPSSAEAWGGVRTGSEPTLSDRVADYRIEAVLDPVQHTVDGKERLTWRNRSAVAVRSLYFHLYLNAFEGKGSTFYVEMARYGGFRTGLKAKKGEWGTIELRSVSQSGKELSWTFVHPDGGPATDRTVVRVDLAEPIPPGASGVLEIEFHDKLPRVVARTGYFGSYHLVGQWFPKIGVLELPGERGATAPRWNCHELHLNSEFYADFGSYDVSITAPKEFVLGAVGEEQGAPVETPRGLRHHFVQDDVHDFAFAAWDRFQTLTASWEGPGSPRVEVKVLYPKEYEKAARVTLEATVESLRYFSETLGPYPYRTSTAVVPPFNAGESAGMEYETFFTSEAFRDDPGLPLVRFVTIHEFGHGYFMGMLASNEFEEPMLDEGLNELWDTRLIAKAPVVFRVPALSRLGFPRFSVDWYDYERGGNPRSPPDPIAGNAWHRYSEASYGLVYTRTTLAFHDLASRIGDDVLAKAMREYYRRWRFRHPSTADLRAVFEDVSGRKEVVDQWFDEQVYDARSIDDRVEKVESAEILPQPGFVVRDGKSSELDQEAIDKEIRARREAFTKEHPKPRPGEPGPFPFRSVVVARRFGPAQVPQTVEVRFEDGSVERMRWDPSDRWQRWTFEKPVRVQSAQLDPDREYLLDLNKLDDGHARETNRLPSTRWTLEASAWTQAFLALLESL
ncbi:MAG: M1 family metallopeptidase [Myxococcales bacterium]